MGAAVKKILVRILILSIVTHSVIGNGIVLASAEKEDLSADSPLTMGELTSAVTDMYAEVDLSEVMDKSFGTQGLIVSTANEAFDTLHAEHVIDVGNDVYILSYGSKEEAKNAYQNYQTMDDITYVEEDSVVETENPIGIKEITSTEEIINETEIKKSTEEIMDTEEVVETESVSEIDVAAETEAIEEIEVVTETEAVDSETKELEIKILEKVQPVKVALLDTGVNETEKVTQEYIADFFTNLSSGGESTSTVDDNGHGTDMAEIMIDTLSDSNKSSTDIQIIPIKVLNEKGIGTITSTYLGILSAIEQGADIINLSLSTKTTSPLLAQAVQMAKDHNIVVIGAAGNNGSDVADYAPGNIADVITVTSVKDKEHLADFANYGNTIDFCSYSDSGTSESTAYVSGLVATLKSNQRDMTIEEIITELISKAEDIGITGWDISFGNGLLGNAPNPNITKDDSEKKQKIKKIENNLDNVLAATVSIKEDYAHVTSPKDLQGTSISASTYKSYYNDILDSLNNSSYKWIEDKRTIKNLPITDWKRSSNYVTKARKSGNENYSWNWSFLEDLNTNIKAEYSVWDGSRNTTHKYSGYLSKGVVTAQEETLYDSATWEQPSGSALSTTNIIEDLTQFKGTFNIDETANPSDYYFTVSSVVDSNKIYLNDNIYVFIYPTCLESKISNSANSNYYYMDFLAFWTGTITAFNNNESFHGVSGTTAHQISNATGYATLTDGWYMNAVKDNAGTAIKNGYALAKGLDSYNGEYTMRVITGDIADGGGMYRLKIGTEPTDVKVKFNGNGATSGTMSALTKVYSKNLTLTANSFVKTGYTFVDWNTKKDGSGETYKNKGTYTDECGVTLYAKWTPNTYYVSYNGNGATSGSMGNSTFTYKKEGNLSNKAFKRLFTATFNGNGGINSTKVATWTSDVSAAFNTWNTLANGKGDTHQNLASVLNWTTTNGATISLYAQWKDGTLTFPTAVRTGYELLGWSTSETATTATYKAGDKITLSANTAYYAVWKELTYQIVYHSNKQGGSEETTWKETKSYFTDYTIMDNMFTHFNYDFLGWSTTDGATEADASYGPGTKDTLNDNLDVYAVWAEKYNVAYIGNEQTAGEDFLNEDISQATEYTFADNVDDVTGDDYYQKDSVATYTDVETGEEVTEDITSTVVHWSLKTDTNNQNMFNTFDIATDVESNVLFDTANKEDVITYGTPNQDYGTYPNTTPQLELFSMKQTSSNQKNQLFSIYYTSSVFGASFFDTQNDETMPYVNMYAVWDMGPTIEAYNLYYTLDEAKSTTETAGITMEELLNQANATDTEDGVLTPGIDVSIGNGKITSFTVSDYAVSDFTSFEHAGMVTITYQAMDSVGNVTLKQVNVHIIDTAPETVDNGKVRFISEKYLNVAKEKGGLSDDSIWKADDEYYHELTTVLNNRRIHTEQAETSVFGKTVKFDKAGSGEWQTEPEQTWSFTHEQVEAVQTYIDINGFGKTKSDTALMEFMTTFASSRQ